ncbi:MAG: hypothetical protein JO039_16285 [Solirubrobacterales bacterium]|nr:hypothetical protein [Solirubrobacterales bacterium]
MQERASGPDHETADRPGGPIVRELGLLLDALSGHALAVAALMLHQQRRRWLSG